MHMFSEAPRCEVPILPCDHIRRVLDEARLTDGTTARAIEIAVLVPMPIDLLASAPIELVDHEGGFMRLADEEGRWAELALSAYAMEALRAAAAGRSSGPLLADDRGRSFNPASCVNEAPPSIMGVKCHRGDLRADFDLLLRSATVHLLVAGIPPQALCLTDPSVSRNDSARRFRLLEAQASAASIWVGKLDLWRRPGRRQDFADRTRDGLRDVDLEDLFLWEPAS